MKYSEKSTGDIAEDLFDGSMYLFLIVATSPVWVPYVAAAVCVKGAAKLIDHAKGVSDGSQSNHHHFSIFHHSKNKGNNAVSYEEESAPNYLRSI